MWRSSISKIKIKKKHCELSKRPTKCRIWPLVGPELARWNTYSSQWSWPLSWIELIRGTPRLRLLESPSDRSIWLSYRWALNNWVNLLLDMSWSVGLIYGFIYLFCEAVTLVLMFTWLRSLWLQVIGMLNSKDAKWVAFLKEFTF